jgi:hypothetical protein
MTEQELLECLEKNYKVRKRRLADAFLRDGARRIDRPLQFDGEKCAICNQPEHGGGLVIYQLQNGGNLRVGHRCAEYLEYLRNNPAYARDYAR